MARAQARMVRAGLAVLVAALGLGAAVAIAATATVAPGDLYTALALTPIDSSTLPAGSAGSPSVSAQPLSTGMVANHATGAVQIDLSTTQWAEYVIFPTGADALAEFKASATPNDGIGPVGLPSPSRVLYLVIPEPAPNGRSMNQSVALVTFVSGNVVISAAAQEATRAEAGQKATAIAQFALARLTAVETPPATTSTTSTAITTTTTVATTTTTTATTTVQPPNPKSPLVLAQSANDAAGSVHLVMTIQLGVVGKSFAIKATGNEEPSLHASSFHMSLGAIAKGAGSIDVIQIGSHAYLHVPSSIARQFSKRGLKPWIALNGKQAANYNPFASELSSIGMAAENDFIPAGAGTDAGLAVHRYIAILNPASASKATPDLNGLTGQGNAFGNSAVIATFDVGDDGYLRRIDESFAFGASGPASISIEIVMSGFGTSAAKIKAPPASQVMTPGQLKQKTGSDLPAI